MSVNNDENLKSSFLAAFQEVEFSKNNENPFKAIDTERRCHFIKYSAAQRL